MRYGVIEGDPIDLGKYPDNTDSIIITLYDESRGEINGDSISGLSLKQIADETSLTKSQVRTRVKKLVNNDHLEEKVPYPDRTRPTKYYEMEKRAKITAWALDLGNEVLGEISEDPSRQDLIDLLGRIAKNEKKIDRLKQRAGRIQANLDEY